MDGILQRQTAGKAHSKDRINMKPTKYGGGDLHVRLLVLSKKVWEKNTWGMKYRIDNRDQ